MTSTFKDLPPWNQQIATFPAAKTKFETQIKASLSELNRDMQNNKMRSLETQCEKNKKFCKFLFQ